MGKVISKIGFFVGFLAIAIAVAAPRALAEDGAGRDDLEMLRAKVVQALKEEIELADPDEGRSAQLLEFAMARVLNADPQKISAAEISRLAPDGRIPGDVAEETHRLLDEFAKEVRRESERLLADAASRYTAQLAGLFRRAMATSEADAAVAVCQEAGSLNESWAAISNTRNLSRLRPDTMQASLDLFAQLHRFREQGDWQSFGSRLLNITRKLGEYRMLFEDGEIQAFEDAMLGLAGLPPVAQLEVVYPEKLGALLDTARQEELPAMAEMLRRYAQVFSAITSSGPYQPLGPRWQGLAQFAEHFEQQIAKVRNGEIPALRAEQWTSSATASMRLPLEREELEQKWRDYQVVLDAGGATRALMPDLDKLLDSIQSLAEIEPSLPEIRYAEQVESASGRQVRLSPRLELLAELHGVIESPERTVLRSELLALLNHSSMNWLDAHLGYVGAETQRARGSQLIERLLDQARRGMAQRFLRGAEISADGGLREALQVLHDRAIDDRDWQRLLVVNRLAAVFFRQGGWISEAERQAVGHLLSAERQREKFNQIRLAVFHLQLAISAATQLPGDALLSEQLAAIKNQFPQAYEQGTEDALLGKLGAMLPPDDGWVIPAMP
ncbi:MAG: hypothetical protein ACO3RV_00340 [Luteolibacter sp.]